MKRKERKAGVASAKPETHEAMPTSKDYDANCARREHLGWNSVDAYVCVSALPWEGQLWLPRANARDELNRCDVDTPR